MKTFPFDEVDAQQVQATLERLSSVCSWSEAKRVKYGISPEQFTAISLLYNGLYAGYHPVEADPVATSEEIALIESRLIEERRVRPVL